nr:alpha-1,4 glucan phosphorylase L-2 isozyme, chloroplastic/amyloplastic [Tanacetum cinerariifolium]
MCFGGKAFAIYVQSKTIVKFIIDVGATVTMILILVFVVPDCYVTVAKVLFLGSDLPQHICYICINYLVIFLLYRFDNWCPLIISTTGMEASGMSDMKFAMSGCIQIATLDVPMLRYDRNLERITFYLFGAQAHEIAGL